ncbi:MAG: hypothetical protein ACTSQF_00090 [Candidatus Heimdallarchaeaceae archaeon]
MSQIHAIQNPDGMFVNTNCFKEEALHFLKYGYYCADPWGSPAWKEYWDEQLSRCIGGYTSGGVFITGNHYGYLNFGQIKVTQEFAEAEEQVAIDLNNPRNRRRQGAGAAKIVTFPNFWSMDYNYFHAVDIARWGAEGQTQEEKQAYVDGLGLEIRILPDALDGGYHMIVGKSRRKGFSYKNGWVAANNYNTIPNSITILGAFDKKYLYPEGTMNMTNNYINFFNEHTGWAKGRDFVSKIDHKKASYEEKDDNDISVEKGYKSTVMALTFKDNPEAAIGKDGTLVEFEEAGKFPNLKEAYMKTKPAMEDGIYTTGQMFIFGTGGDMESGTTDFAEMFFKPTAFKLLPFRNIWDKNISDTAKCGFFVPDYWNKPGFIDEDGNSDNQAALEYEQVKREQIIRDTSGTSTLNEYIQQYPQEPSEAFLTVSHNEFPVVELRNHLNKIIAEDLYIKTTQPVWMFRDNETGKARMRPDMKNELNPVVNFPTKGGDKTGCWVIVEAPVPNAPRGLYKGGYDPYRQDQSEGESLGAFYIYKSANDFSYTRDKIVAWYVGRPITTDVCNRNVELGAELYNLELMHENEVVEVKSYFNKRKKLHLLAAQPDAVISKNIKNSRVARVYGIHMNDKLKDAGEKYIKRWLLEERDVDEHGEKILNLETIDDIGLLEELISYHRKGNFDRVMAFMMVMFQIEEEAEGKVYGDNKVTQVAQQIHDLKLFARKN